MYTHTWLPSEVHNLVTPALLARGCRLGLGGLVVRQLRGHLCIALLQQLLEVIEGLSVLRTLPLINSTHTAIGLHGTCICCIDMGVAYHTVYHRMLE